MSMHTNFYVGSYIIIKNKEYGDIYELVMKCFGNENDLNWWDVKEVWVVLPNHENEGLQLSEFDEGLFDIPEEDDSYLMNFHDFLEFEKIEHTLRYGVVVYSA